MPVGYVLVGALAGYALLKSAEDSTAKNPQNQKDFVTMFSDFFNPGSQPQTGNGSSNTDNNWGRIIGAGIGALLDSHFWEGSDTGSKTQSESAYFSS